MLFVTHTFLGVLLYLIAVLVFPVNWSVLGFTAFFLGVSAPDLDHKNSKAGRLLKPVSWLLHTVFGHRGLIHSLLGALFLSFVFGFLIQFVGLSSRLTGWFFFGFLAHLVGDSLTPSGIKWFYPFSKKRFRSFIRTGSMIEVLFLALVLIGVWKVGLKLIF